jgi:hypothetical protein
MGMTLSRRGFFGTSAIDGTWESPPIEPVS